jgi:DNA-binding response OmpR family regulator
MKTYHDRVNLGSILIIEDDKPIAEVLVLKLQTEGFRGVVATTVRDSIQKLRNQRFSCVILDMVLRDGSHGEELLPALQAHWKNALVPIVVTSGSLEVELVKRLAAHVKAVFVKPYDFDEVIKKVIDVTPLN